VSSLFNNRVGPVDIPLSDSRLATINEQNDNNVESQSKEQGKSLVQDERNKHARNGNNSTDTGHGVTESTPDDENADSVAKTESSTTVITVASFNTYDASQDSGVCGSEEIVREYLNSSPTLEPTTPVPLKPHRSVTFWDQRVRPPSPNRTISS